MWKGRVQLEYNNVQEDLVKVKAFFVRCFFPRPPVVLGEGDNTYGVTRWEVDEVLEGDTFRFINSSFHDQITVVGDFSLPLKMGTPYVLLLKEKEHPQYGKQFQVLYVNEKVDMKKISNQKAFLSTFLTNLQMKALFEMYENPIELLENKDMEGLQKVKGIGPYIAKSIIDRYEDKKDMSQVYVELDGYGLTPNFIQRLIKRYYSASAVIKAVKENPYQLVYDMEGIGFKTADDIALRGGLDPKSVERVKAYITYFLRQQAYEDGNSYVTAGELLTEIHSFFGGKENIVEEYTDCDGNVIGTNIGNAINELQEKEFLNVEEGPNKSRRRVYLTEIRKLEEDISYHLTRLLSSQNYFAYSNWRQKVANLEEKQGFKFAEEQINGIKLGLDSQVCLISGLAGSGKSSLVSGILAALDSYSFAQCALSGKAAARLQEVTGQSGQTIHRLLGFGSGEQKFFYNGNNPLPYNIVILDEVSLVGGNIFLDLLKAIPNGTKLIMLGDMGQLESIGVLNLAADMYDSECIPTVELKEVHRQAAKSGIITSAHAVRNQEQLYDEAPEDIDVRGELRDMIFDVGTDRSEDRHKVIGWFKKYYESDLVEKDIMKIQLIAPVKERGDCCVFNLNLDVQEYLNPALPNRQYVSIGRGEKEYHIRLNDKVMCIKNNYHTLNPDGEICPIYNGWVGIVKGFFNDNIIIDFPLAGGSVYLPKKDASAYLTLGYASTVHKLQGSDAPVVIGCINYATPPKMLTCQLLYTLITRAKKRCVVVAEYGALRKAIDSDYVSTKRTFLKGLLAEKVKRLEQYKPKKDDTETDEERMKMSKEEISQAPEIS